MNKSIIQNGEENNNYEERLQVGKVVEEEEEEERQKWSNPIEFLLSCIAMSVRLLTTSCGLDTHVEAHFQRRSGLATFGASRTLLMRTVAALF